MWDVKFVLFLASPRGLGVTPCLLFLFLRTGWSRSSTNFTFLSPRDASTCLPSSRRCEKHLGCHTYLSSLMLSASSAGSVSWANPLFMWPSVQVSPDVSSCLSLFSQIWGTRVSPGLACCCACRDSDWTALCLGSPDVSTDAGILMCCQTSGNAHMHRSLELLLVWKLMIFLCVRNWTLLGSFGWSNCTCVTQLFFSALEGEARFWRGVGCVSKPSTSLEV